MAVDKDDILYITDLENGKILVYTTDGGFKAAIGQPGSEPGQFNLLHAWASH